MADPKTKKITSLCEMKHSKTEYPDRYMPISQSAMTDRKTQKIIPVS
jgi:hypothetical protein